MGVQRNGLEGQQNIRYGILEVAINIFIYHTTMSYQTVTQLVPNYVVKSDYLPTRVVDGNQLQHGQLVLMG